jgi:hypothetical protein
MDEQAFGIAQQLVGKPHLWQDEDLADQWEVLSRSV